GTHLITAAYGGSGTFDPSASDPVTVTVSLVPTTAALTVDQTTLTPGETVTLTATLTAADGTTPTGTVRFYNDGLLLESASLSGGRAQVPINSLTIGEHEISMIYRASGRWDRSTSASVTVTVRKLGTTTRVTPPPPSTVTPLDPVTFTADVWDE